MAAGTYRRDYSKWALFAALGALVLLSAWLDDRFVFNPKDPTWGKFAAWWYMAPHVLAGGVALLAGPWQFSDRLRRDRPSLHRKIGWLYIAASLASAPLAGVMAWERHTPGLAYAQVAQSSFWMLATLLAWLNAMSRNFPAHKLWMMRSYGFCLVFILGRIPDIVPKFDWDGLPGITWMWASVVMALLVPDLILNGRELMRRRSRASA